MLGVSIRRGLHGYKLVLGAHGLDEESLLAGIGEGMMLRYEWAPGMLERSTFFAHRI